MNFWSRCRTIFAQYLNNLNLYFSGGDKRGFEKIPGGILNIVSKILLKFDDPIIKQEIAGKKLKLPFSHRLPLYTRLFPQYATNLGRIARYTFEKYSQLTIIDVGANIGDSIAIVRKEAQIPILCIEGNEFFFGLLEENARQFSKVRLIKTFLGETNGTVQTGLAEAGGTARLTSQAEVQNNIEIKTLPALLEAEPAFEISKLLKVDTDGFDLIILRGAVSFLKKARPVIFFEYDPFLLAQQGEDGLSLFRLLEEVGYKWLLVYDNLGDMLLSTDLACSSLLKDIDLYFSGHKGIRYCDICAFHAEDTDLFERARASEVQYFRKLKGLPSI